MYSIVLCQYIWVIFYWSFSLVQANSNDSIWRIVLPEQLQNWNCQYYVGSGALTMNCDIDKHLQWTLHDFRIWAESQELKELRLHLQCYGDGSISLRQPIGAKDLTELRIGNCYVYNYTNYEISNHTTNLDNRIRTIEYFNSVFRENGMDLIQHILQWENFTSVSKCYMPESLVTFTRSNCSREYSPIKLKDQGIKILRARNEECLKFKLLNLCKHNYLKIFEYKNEHNSLNEGALDDIFKYGFFPELQTINLTDLQLTKVPTQLTQRQWWLRFSKVKSIDVSKNLISTISFDTAPYNKTIFVNMTDNKISKLSRSAIDQLRTIYPTIIDFSKNEIECSCTEEFQSTLNFISNLNDGWEQYYKFLKTETCFKRNISLESFDYFTECAPKPDPILNDRNVIILICLFSVFFGLSCISVTIRFRREIKILTYTRLKIKIGRTPRTHRLIKEYDAFVSYSHLDEKWVTESLCKHLEHSPPYFRLCLHHKHFVPGACISDNIIESVEKSRHTIIVLSNNFLQSEWCILEFRKAFHQNLLERKRHLIVIMLDEISQEDLEPDMKHFLRTHTYLKKSDYIFWDKLIYSLSDSRSVVYSESDSSTRATTNDVKLCVDGKTNESKDETNTQPSVS